MRQQAEQAFETENKGQRAIYMRWRFCILSCLNIAAGQDFRYVLFINGKDASSRDELPHRLSIRKQSKTLMNSPSSPSSVAPLANGHH